MSPGWRRSALRRPSPRSRPQARHPILRVARVFFEVGEHFRIRDLVAKAAAIGALDTYDRLAIGHAGQ